ncbi:MAG: tRNA pseudouridine(38-40) synthase TruA [Pseudomonadota bacterium]|nr:tRNA pseudouridine(38-40) synthase TruA [Pseudomonadota bacterium]
MQRWALGVQYDGSSWHGWQTQPSRHTVQDQLERALHEFACTPITVTCAGRTDAGVHALEQVVHFDCAVDRSPSSWVRGVNRYLPPSIAIRWASVIPGVGAGDMVQEFHARFSARSRTYCYVLYNHPVRSPLWAGRAGWVFRALDVERMQRAADMLIGTHDFTAFRAADCQARTPVKTVYAIEVVRHGNLVVLTICANAFLQHMVRNLVGALIYVGTGRQDPTWLGELLAEKNRHLAAPTFSPDGLYLAKIDYDPSWQLPQSRLAPVDLFF